VPWSASHHLCSPVPQAGKTTPSAGTVPTCRRTRDRPHVARLALERKVRLARASGTGEPAVTFMHPTSSFDLQCVGVARDNTGMPTKHEISPSLRAILQGFASALLERYGDDFAGLWLYGSHARGEAREDSDVDVLLLLRKVVQPGREIDRIGDLLADVNLKHGLLLSVLPVEEQEFRRAEGAFWRNVRADGFAA